MITHPCPHCGANSISGLRKMCLGPVTATMCSECKGKVGVPYGKSFLAMIPFIAVACLAPFVRDNGTWSFYLGLFGGMFSMILWGSIVPLVKR